MPFDFCCCFVFSNPDPLGNGELAILSKHLESTYGDLHEMSLRFEQVVQRTKLIEAQIDTTINVLKRNQEKVNDLEEKVKNRASNAYMFLHF